MSETINEIKADRQWTWDQWMESRHLRRLAGNKVAPEVIRRRESKDDKRLKEAFDGERGPDFASDEDLLGLKK